MNIDLSKYRRPALQFSGGKDSLACLYLLRDHLDLLTVYWMDTGDGCPETAAVIEQVRPMIPRFEVIRADAKAWRAENGMPSDLVPVDGHLLGRAYGLSDTGVVGRFTCCWANLMQPMHQRMIDDGVDAVIRGTKLTDTGKVPVEGPTEFYDVLLPLRDWSHADVFGYLESVGAPKNPIYDYFRGISAPECMGCTAWWDDGKAHYLKALHPQRHAEYVQSLRTLKAMAEKHLRELDSQLEA